MSIVATQNLPYSALGGPTRRCQAGEPVSSHSRVTGKQVFWCFGLSVAVPSEQGRNLIPPRSQTEDSEWDHLLEGFNLPATMSFL